MKYVIIADETVDRLYGDQLACDFDSPQRLTFPAGELYKTRETKQHLEDQLLAQGYGRDTTLIALGGGVVTDLVGFLAATFCRGVDLILVPTTLLAMVDASIGGKNGVNTPHGKNRIGTFYEPIETILNFDFLRTLPQKEIWNGYVEMWKAGLVADPSFFRSFGELPEAIQRARALKTAIVKQDHRDQSLRKVLHLGHTLGHALETASEYHMPHGIAVAIGIVLESRMSRAMGLLSAEDLAQIEDRFPLPKLSYDPQSVIELLHLQKGEDQKPRFILLETIGKAIECPVPFDLIHRVLNDATVCSC